MEETNSELEIQSDGKTQLTEDEILELFHDLREEAAVDQRHRDNALLVEAFSQNRSTVGLVDPDIENLIFWDKEQTIALQEMRNANNTWSSLITKDYPSVVCAPSKQDAKSVAAAEIGTAYIEYQQTELNTADKIKSTAKLVVEHGTAFTKTLYNKESNRIELSVHSIFDVFIQCADDPDQCQWAVERTYIDKWEAKKLLKSVKPNTDPKTVSYTDGAGISRKNKVEKWCIWYLPGDRFEKGLYATIIDNTVVEAIDYPFVFEEKDGQTTKAMLPFTWFTCVPIRGSTLGTTFAVECCPAQAALNKIFNRMVANALQSKQILMVPKVLETGGVLEASPEENERYLYLSPSQLPHANIIKWLSPAAADPALQDMIANLQTQIWEIAGINKSTGGGDGGGALPSARAMAYQAELDLNKHSHAITSFRRYLKTLWELVLKLTQKYYTTVQQFSITGKNPIWFSGADLAGVDVRLEDRSEAESTAAVKRENAQNAVANGFAGPETLLKVNPTLVSESQKLFANDFIQDVLDGKDVNTETIFEQLDPAILIEQIDLKLSELRLQQQFENVQVLQDFRVWVLRNLNSTATADPAAGGGQPQQPPTAPLPESIGQEPLPPAI